MARSRGASRVDFGSRLLDEKPAKPAKKSTDTKFKIQIDERTRTMPAEALECRSSGHAWQRVPLSAARRLELLQRGETETIRICTRCRSRRTDVYELPSFATLYSKIDYSDGYLIAKEHQGSGRLPRQAALAASIVAEIPELVAV